VAQHRLLRQRTPESEDTVIKVYAFRAVPDFAKGLVRDLRVRWALEEAGLDYETRLIDRSEADSAAYRALQPFGQVPVFDEDGLVLFESGAIVLHIGERSETLLPREAAQRARATQWLLAALNSIEPLIQEFGFMNVVYANEEWAKLKLPLTLENMKRRLSALSGALGDKPYLDGSRFTAGDLMMVSVLRILGDHEVIRSERRLSAYIDRCTARPAFQRALAAQLGDFERAA
jgi:glutathione S-transferase